MPRVTEFKKVHTISCTHGAVRQMFELHDVFDHHVRQEASVARAAGALQVVLQGGQGIVAEAGKPIREFRVGCQRVRAYGCDVCWWVGWIDRWLASQCSRKVNVVVVVVVCRRLAGTFAAACQGLRDLQCHLALHVVISKGAMVIQVLARKSQTATGCPPCP